MVREHERGLVKGVEGIEKRGRKEEWKVVFWNVAGLKKRIGIFGEDWKHGT